VYGSVYESVYGSVCRGTVPVLPKCSSSASGHGTISRDTASRVLVECEYSVSTV
jgi:hypothetical protein